jgi:lipopolysaccharide assembly outer membrane protein LptD (OstA)
MCASVFGQDRVDEQRGRLARQMAQEKVMAQAIIQHRPIQLPGAPLGPNARITALNVRKDDGANFLRLGGVEIRDNSLVIQAQELSYSWATGDVELIGKVRVKAIPQ